MRLPYFHKTNVGPLFTYLNKTGLMQEEAGKLSLIKESAIHIMNPSKSGIVI